MALNWRKKDYFHLLIGKKDEVLIALELLVDDLHKDKPRTVSTFLAHCGSEDFLWGLVHMLRHKNARVAGNSAYILGTLAEHQLGQARVLSIVNGRHQHTILDDLSNMLDRDDSESVMNAAGTLGTLAETDDGRAWMLLEPCIDSTISKLMTLLAAENKWTASNAALVLARLSISEQGCQHLLCHRLSHELLTQLIKSLGVDEAGRGMNAAFAIGRMSDTEEGRQRLIQHQDISEMISGLNGMLSSKDPGCGKNSCFAVSCLAGNKEGHALLLNHPCSDVMLKRLAEQLDSKDPETLWFAAMTLRTIASQQRGCIVMRDHVNIVPALQEIDCRPGLSQDLRDEIGLTLEILKKLEKPDPPMPEVNGPSEILVTWDAVVPKSGLDVTYKLYKDSNLLYKGDSKSFLASSLKPNTCYVFQLQLTTEGDESVMSDGIEATTEQCAPDAPEALRILGVSTSQIKIGWSPPEFFNGGLKGYIVYNGKQQIEQTTELCCILSSLAPATKYDIYVCAVNHKGKGPKAWMAASTEELGKHAPSKPLLNVRGRNEIHVTWTPPEFPLGRLHKFEMTLNGKVVYSGTELCFTARRLIPNTEYTFKVIAVTSEGRCESEPTKRKTPKDEYNVQSTAPIFFSHPHKPDQEPITYREKTKQQCQLLSKGNRTKTPASQKQRNTSSPSDLTESRPSTGVSSTLYTRDHLSESTEYRRLGDSIKRSSIQPYLASTSLDNKSDRDKGVDTKLIVRSDDATDAGHRERSDDPATDAGHREWSDESLDDETQWKNSSKEPGHDSSRMVSQGRQNSWPTAKNQMNRRRRKYNENHTNSTQEESVDLKRRHLHDTGWGPKSLNDQKQSDNEITDEYSVSTLGSVLKGTSLGDINISTVFDQQSTSEERYLIDGDIEKEFNSGSKSRESNSRSTGNGIEKSRESNSRSTGNGIEKSRESNSRRNQSKRGSKSDGSDEDMNFFKCKEKQQNISVASVKEGPADGIGCKERQQTLASKRLYEIKHRQFLDADIDLNKQEFGLKYRSFKGSTQTKKSPKVMSVSHDKITTQHKKSPKVMMSVSHDSTLQGSNHRRGSHNSSRYSPTMRPRFKSATNSLDKIHTDNTDAFDSNDFVLSVNGTIIYTEGDFVSPTKTMDKSCRGDQSSKEHVAAEEMKYSTGSVFRGKEPLSARSHLFPWERDDPLFHSASSERHAEHEMSKNIPAFHKSFPKASISAHIDLLNDQHAYSERATFYNRAQTFMSSHRPLLKKTLEKMPSQVPESIQMAANSSGMEFTVPQPLSNNRYQFFPMQFRTQPLHMPASPLHPDNPNGNLYDKGAYVRKLETMSYLSASKKHSCPPVMRFSHRESPTLQIDSAKSQSTSGVLTDAAH